MSSRFFEVDGSEMEVEGWCVLMLEFLWKKQAVGTTMLDPWVVE